MKGAEFMTYTADRYVFVVLFFSTALFRDLKRSGVVLIEGCVGETTEQPELYR